MILRALVGILVLAVPASGLCGDDPSPGIDSYGNQLSVRLWGAVTRQEMFDSRVAVSDENARMTSGFWTGTVDEGALKRALSGGAEVSYGFFRDVKVLLAFEGRGSSAEGSFEGWGANAVLHPTEGILHQNTVRLSRFASFGSELGTTLLLREFGWCRLGLTGRFGWHSLASSVERGSESGPLRNFGWKRRLSGSAPGGLLGVEWEWLSSSRTLPLSGFLMAGYRWLDFTRVEAAYSDSTGLSWSSAYRDADGSRRSLDFSGPEFRFGLQIVASYAIRPFEHRDY